MSGNDSQIIIKKIKKINHGKHHGGAWKVAYADFITAMMALFLVLWLVAMLSVQAKKAVANYFRSYTIFKGDEAGGGKGISITPGGIVKVGEEDSMVVYKEMEDVEIASKIGQMVEKKLGELKNQVIISVTGEGVRIELIDKIGSPMFELGKATLIPTGMKILNVISESLKDINNKITIEGHTDSYKYSAENYSNWELAADRANAVRRALIENGIDITKIVKVVSFADNMPLNKDNPFDPLNRRVSILIDKKENLENTIPKIKPISEIKENSGKSEIKKEIQKSEIPNLTTVASIP